MKALEVEKNRYFDSVFLMRISATLERVEGVRQAVVAMGTPANLALLVEAGFSVSQEILPGDLVIALEGETEEALERAQAELQVLLTGTGLKAQDGEPVRRPSTLIDAAAADPEANLALISVPGAYAAREARWALRKGLHVLLFSDNVSVEEEIALKDEAIRRGLLMMGPDCGTAILQGIPLGFVNVCRRGSVGLVGASGTGLQEISSLIHQWGGGISHAIGTGGRDLSRAVNGRMTLFALDLLAHDPETEVLVVVSKTPEPAVADRVLRALEAAKKPAIVQFVGERSAARSGCVEISATLADAARAAVCRAGNPLAARPGREEMEAASPSVVRGIEGNLLGLFCGGTLGQEAAAILAGQGVELSCDLSQLHPDDKEPRFSDGHAIWDLGDDRFTRGKPHPMIEPRLRDAYVARAGEDRRVGLVLADCVIGFGAHENPAQSLAEAAQAAMGSARRDGRWLAVVASVTGTDDDPQGRS
ncbi:MAG TPA: acyl-CoA synthetase FdrA, partial [Candidatus Acetothermia bacterium]|nr:acyl-CoA synthetase FdrA [Candidatus Acetothermia bacterium]